MRWAYEQMIGQDVPSKRANQEDLDETMTARIEKWTNPVQRQSIKIFLVHCTRSSFGISPDQRNTQRRACCYSALSLGVWAYLKLQFPVVVLSINQLTCKGDR